MQPPHCGLGRAAAGFSWIRRNHWQLHRESGKAVDIQVSGREWRPQTWCSGSSAARMRRMPQSQSALSRPQCGPLYPAFTYTTVNSALPGRSLRRWPCPHHIVLGPPAPTHLLTTRHTSDVPSSALYRWEGIKRGTN